METEEIKKRMHTGEIYYENEEIFSEKLRYNDLLFEFNHLKPSDREGKAAIMSKLFGAAGEGLYIEQPLHANWGENTYFGKNVYVNFNLTLVDDTKVEIHDHVMIGPNVTLCTGTHPLDPELRIANAQFNLPIIIEENVWLGAGTLVLPGVKIGKNTVIGAGSIVTKDIPENVLAVGSPCRVVKTI